MSREQDTTLTLGSLFDGSSGFPLAASLCGIEPVWASEIEPYPIAVTRSRFPRMRHLGDIHGIRGSEIEPVDVISFGSPCQDLSVAGKRAGIHEGARSNLFFEAIRVIREMRGGTNGKYPTFAIWENVPGAFSSNSGEDFRCVLEALARVRDADADIPLPAKGRWPGQGAVMGDNWSIAWRVLDAQYWGVPQRRRRIYLVADFAGGRAGKILFEREGLRGDTAQGGASGQGAAADAPNSSGADSRTGYLAKRYLFENHSQDARYTCSLEVCPVLVARLGTGGNNTPYVVERKPTAYCIGNGQLNQISVDKQANTFDCMHDVQAVIVVFGKEAYTGGLNAAFDFYIHEGGPAGTLTTSAPPAICVNYVVRRLTPTECARLQGFPDTWGTLVAKEELDAEDYAFWLRVRNAHAVINGRTARDYSPKQMLRWYNSLHTDTAEYKMWGNGIALPCAIYVMEGMAQYC